MNTVRPPGQTSALESTHFVREAAALQFLSNISLTGVPCRPLAGLTSVYSSTAQSSTQDCATLYGTYSKKTWEETNGSSNNHVTTIKEGLSNHAAPDSSSQSIDGQQKSDCQVEVHTAVYASPETISVGNILTCDNVASQSVLALQFLNNISLGSHDGDDDVQREYSSRTGRILVSNDTSHTANEQGECVEQFRSDGRNDGTSLQSVNPMGSPKLGFVEGGLSTLEQIAERGILRQKTKVTSGKFGSRRWLTSNSETHSNDAGCHTTSRQKGRTLRQLCTSLHTDNGRREYLHQYSQGETPTSGELAGSLLGNGRGSFAERTSVDTHRSRSLSLSETKQSGVQVTGNGQPLISHHRERLGLATSHLSKNQKLPATSYHFLLEPSWGEHTDPRERTGIDDPTIKSGKHRTVLTLQSLMVSVIQYAEPNELKRDLNEQFRERNADVNITLSKLRSLKQQMMDMALNKCSLDLATLALSFIYFERLVVKGVVAKHNRRLLAGVSLLLAAKFYNQNVSTAFLCHLIDVIEEELHVSGKEVRGNEFSAFAHLNFGLHVELDVFMTIFQRVRMTVPDYKKKLFDPLAIACHGPITSSPSL